MGVELALARAVKDFAINDAFSIDNIDEIAPKLIEGYQHVYYSYGA